MTTLDLRTGYACNNRCRFCDQGNRRDALGQVAAEVILDNVNPGDAVWLAGGEVSLRTDLPALLRGVRDRGASRIGIQTNGRILAAPGAAMALKAQGLTDVAVALHGASASIHEYLVGAPGAFRHTISGVRRCRDAGLTVRVHTVMCRSNLEQLPAIAHLAIHSGATSHRWIAARAQGAGLDHARSVVPRLDTLRAPLAAAIAIGHHARIEVETTGVPLCALPSRGAAAADRIDTHPVVRVAPPGFPEPPPTYRQGPPCAGCRLNQACIGVESHYAATWGWDEIHAVEGPPSPLQRTLFLPVSAPCALRCTGCATRAAWGEEWETDSTRILRQHLVRAAGEHPEVLAFAGASPWDHPSLPLLVREATRLGLSHIEVWGPLHPVVDLNDSDLDRLAGLRAARAPILPDPVTGISGAQSRAEAGADRLRQHGIEVSFTLPGVIPGDLYRASGARAVWSGCQPAEPR